MKVSICSSCVFRMFLYSQAENCKGTFPQDSLVGNKCQTTMAWKRTVGSRLLHTISRRKRLMPQTRTSHGIADIIFGNIECAVRTCLAENDDCLKRSARMCANANSSSCSPGLSCEQNKGLRDAVALSGLWCFLDAYHVLAYWLAALLLWLTLLSCGLLITLLEVALWPCHLSPCILQLYQHEIRWGRNKNMGACMH